ncbi:MAG: hypothetical protein ABI413_10290, partial [Ktedonobacteraceae bacterium]
VSKAKKIEAMIGMIFGIISVIWVVVIIIAGAVTNTSTNDNLGTGIFVGILILAESAAIWRITRIKTKKKP